MAQVAPAPISPVGDTWSLLIFTPTSERPSSFRPLDFPTDPVGQPRLFADDHKKAVGRCHRRRNGSLDPARVLAVDLWRRVILECEVERLVRIPGGQEVAVAPVVVVVVADEDLLLGHPATSSVVWLPSLPPSSRPRARRKAGPTGPRCPRAGGGSWRLGRAAGSRHDEP